MFLAFILAAFLGLGPLLLLGPKLASFLAPATMGFYLYKKTAGRSSQITDRVDEDEKKWVAAGNKKSDSDEEWENVEGYAALTTAKNEKADLDWNGFIGFFHPFWYVVSSYGCEASG